MSQTFFIINCKHSTLVIAKTEKLKLINLQTIKQCCYSNSESLGRFIKWRLIEKSVLLYPMFQIYFFVFSQFQDKLSDLTHDCLKTRDEVKLIANSVSNSFIVYRSLLYCSTSLTRLFKNYQLLVLLQLVLRLALYMKVVL